MTSGCVAVVGENLVDLLVDEGGAVLAAPGGGPFNVARAISRLGGSALLFSRFSSDYFGRMLVDRLNSDGVSMVFPEAIPLPTTLAVVEPGPHYSFHLNGTASFQLDASEAVEAFDAAAESVTALYVGTLGLVVEPMATTGERLVAQASKETIVVIDPNCRPSALLDHGEYRARLERLYARADIVKVSSEDLDYLSPGIASGTAAGAILDAGARLVLITDGPHPVRVVTSTSDFIVTVPTTRAVDTIGAGDALVGAFIHWWTSNGCSRHELADVALITAAVHASIAVSSMTCTRKGADPPWLAELLEYGEWTGR